MRKYFSFILFLLFAAFIYTGCGSDSTTGPDPTPALAFTISLDNSPITGTAFLAQSNYDVFFNYITVLRLDDQYTQTFQQDSNQTYTPKDKVRFGVFNDLNPGQKWDITFVGKRIDNGERFTKKESYTIP